LKSVDFKWHQFDRQPSKQWLLWLASAFADGFTGMEDLGIDLAENHDGTWFCWLRGDYCSRYSRFVHIRHIRTQEEVIKLVEALTGQAWNPENHLYGAVRRPEVAARIRKDDERLDRVMVREGRPWREIEKNDSRGGALPEHMEVAEEARKEKR